MGLGHKVRNLLGKSDSPSSNKDELKASTSQSQSQSQSQGSSDKASSPQEQARTAAVGSKSSQDLGIEILYPGESPIIVDIIFLHGLTGHRSKTWTANGAVMPWPKTLLANDIPNARIVTYGYDADVVNWTRPAGQNTIREHARNLVNDLSNLRLQTKSTKRPIIFVAHSLGGLLCEDALLLCTNPEEETQADILASTRGVAFLGTPHAGSDLEKFASAVANIISLSFIKKPDGKLLKVLNGRSEILANIKNGFLTMVRTRSDHGKAAIKLHAFVEELAVTATGHRVVTPDSAIIPGYSSSTIPKNHMNMTKFLRNDELGYKRVSGTLLGWVSELKEDDKLVGGVDHSIVSLHISERPVPLANAVTTYKVPFKLPKYVVGKFVAREDETKKLGDSLSPGIRQERRQSFVIHGLGGSGKTQLMLEFARTRRDDYTAVLCSGSSVYSRLRLARRYFHTQKGPDRVQEESLEDMENSESLLEALVSATNDWLCAEANNNWLLLFDNVDREFPSKTNDPQAYDINLYIPASDHGSIIITTRRSDLCQVFGASLTLTQMSKAQGLQVLAERSGRSLDDMPDQAKMLVERVGSLPLALAQAGSYLRECPSFSEYLTLYNNKWKEIMGDNGDGELSVHDYAHGSVGTTWSVSYEYIKLRDPLAASLLRVLAYFNGANIDREIFQVDSEQSLATWRDPPELVKEAYSLLSFQRMMRSLLALSLIQQRRDLRGYEIHPVVQDWCLSTLSSQSARDEFAVLALRILGSSCQRAGEKSWEDTQVIRDRLILHATRCLELINDDIEVRDSTLSDIICRHFHSIGSLFVLLLKNREATPLLRRAFCGFRRLFGIRSTTTKLYASTLAENLIATDKFLDAETVIQEVLNESEPIDGKNDGLTLILMRCLAKCYENLGRSNDVEALLSTVIDELRQDWSERHIQIITTEEHYAEFLIRQKRFDKAEDVLLQILKEEKEWNCLPRLTLFQISCGLLVQVYEELKKFSEAESHLMAFLHEWERQYGARDCWTLSTVLKLGSLYMRQEKYSKAEEQFRRLSNYQVTTLDATGGIALQGALGLAECLRKLRKLKEAETICQQIIKKLTSLLGAEHLNTVISIFLMCQIKEDQGCYDAAEELCKQALEGRKKQVPEQDPGLLIYSHELGNIYRQQGRLSEAESLMQNVIIVSGQVLGPEDPATLSRQHTLSMILNAQNKYAEAELVSRRVLKAQERILGPKSSPVLYTLGELADILKRQGRLLEAVDVLSRVLEIREEVKGPEHIENVATIFSLAKTLQKMGTLDRAEKLLRRCLLIVEKSYDPDHKDIFQSVLHLASCLREQNQHDAAAQQYLRLYNKMKLTSPEDPQTSDLLFFIAQCYLGQLPDKLGLAESTLQECLKHRLRFLSTDHTTTLIAAYMLATVHLKQGRLESAAEMIQPIVEKLMNASTTLELASFEEIAMIEGEIYWRLGRYKDAKTAYRRCLAVSFIRAKKLPLESSIIFRADLHEVDMAVYLETFIQSPTADGKNNVPNGIYRACSSCEECIYGVIHHCLYCSDEDFCSQCFYRLQHDDLHLSPQATCSKMHKFLSVPRSFWGADHVFDNDGGGVVDEEGTTYEVWMMKLMKDFLEKMTVEDELWMRFLSKEKQSNLCLYPGDESSRKG